MRNNSQKSLASAIESFGFAATSIDILLKPGVSGPQGSEIAFPKCFPNLRSYTKEFTDAIFNGESL
jgi:hypothetical protein